MTSHDDGEVFDNEDTINIVPQPIERAVVPKQGTPLALCPSNLDMSTHRGKALALKAGSPGELQVTDTEPLRMRVTHWMILPDTQIDEKSGECKEFVRVVLFDKDGRTFRTTAAHGPFRLRAMMDMYGPDDWAAGVPVVVSVRKSKRGTTYHDIQIDLSV